MAIVLRNNNRALMTTGAARVAYQVGQRALTPAGRAMIWNGAKFIAETLWNRRKNKQAVTDLVVHPGAHAGAVAAPVAISRAIRGSKPKFQRSKGAVTITHREFLGQFNSSIDYTVNRGIAGNQFRINPSNFTVFPWLQSMAANFDMYKFDSLALQYVPLCATTQTGRIALYFDKDSQDLEPGDRAELANMAHLTETAPWAEARLGVPLDNTKRFINDNNTSDKKLIDLGQFGVAAYGSSNGNPAGDVFVHYTVTFYEPQPTAPLVQTLSVGPGGVTAGPNLFIVETLGSVGVLVKFNAPGTYLVSFGVRALTFTTTSALGDAIVNSVVVASAGGSHFVGIANITVATARAGLLIAGTGMNNYSVHASRATKANNANIP